jgi:hypothetical protein
VNFLDDHSRVAVASRVLKVATAPKVLEFFGQAGTTWGLPAALLTTHSSSVGPPDAWFDRPAGQGSEGPAPAHRR